MHYLSYEDARTGKMMALYFAIPSSWTPQQVSADKKTFIATMLSHTGSTLCTGFRKLASDQTTIHIHALDSVSLYNGSLMVVIAGCDGNGKIIGTTIELEDSYLSWEHSDEI